MNTSCGRTARAGRRAVSTATATVFSALRDVGPSPRTRGRKEIRTATTVVGMIPFVSMAAAANTANTVTTITNLA